MEKKKIIVCALAIVGSALVRDFKWISLILAICIVAILAIDIYEKRKLEKQIRELTDYITRVQDAAALPEMSESTEGSIGILQSEIYKVVTILREEYSSEHRQKKYMSDMMSDISHQFKTPLTAISLMTELLMEPEVSEEQRLEYTAKIDSQINKMTWLIRNLLTLSQLEAGVLEMKSEQIVLKDMIDEISDSLGVMAEVAEVNLEVSVSEEITVKGDKHWLREAVTNIVKNCIEHTASGGYVKLKASQNNLCCTLRIEDNGKGIAKEHLDHIFERFYKAGNASPNSVGIGLAMAKQIINSHGGTIEVNSVLDEGSEFVIKLYS